jgi:hypothetical protein
MAAERDAAIAGGSELSSLAAAAAAVGWWSPLSTEREADDVSVTSMSGCDSVVGGGGGGVLRSLGDGGATAAADLALQRSALAARLTRWEMGEGVPTAWLEGVAFSLRRRLALAAREKGLTPAAPPVDTTAAPLGAEISALASAEPVM